MSAAAILTIGLLHQSVGPLSEQKAADISVTRLQRIVGRHSCVVSDQPSLLLLADAFDRSRCPSWLDPRGAALTELRGPQTAGFYPSGFQKIPRWQREYVALIAHADYLILTGPPLRHVEWTTATGDWVQTHFCRIAEVGHAGPARIPVEVWQRRV